MNSYVDLFLDGVYRQDKGQNHFRSELDFSSMAPYGGLANSLPVLNKIFQWFMVDHLRIEGGLFRLHQKGTSLIVLIGFIFISIENFVDTRSILCLNNNNAYAKHFCWIHGYSYVAKHLQGK